VQTNGHFLLNRANLIDSIGSAATEAINSYDKHKEAGKLTEEVFQRESRAREGKIIIDYVDERGTFPNSSSRSRSCGHSDGPRNFSLGYPITFHLLYLFSPLYPFHSPLFFNFFDWE
jgi:hypothetical protein